MAVAVTPWMRLAKRSSELVNPAMSEEHIRYQTRMYTNLLSTLFRFLGCRAVGGSRRGRRRSRQQRDPALTVLRYACGILLSPSGLQTLRQQVSGSKSTEFIFALLVGPCQLLLPGATSNMRQDCSKSPHGWTPSSLVLVSILQKGSSTPWGSRCTASMLFAWRYWPFPPISGTERRERRELIRRSRLFSLLLSRVSWGVCIDSSDESPNPLTLGTASG